MSDELSEARAEMRMLVQIASALGECRFPGSEFRRVDAMMSWLDERAKALQARIEAMPQPEPVADVVLVPPPPEATA